MMTLPDHLRTPLSRLVEALGAGLGDNLHSCILYGSAVRGDYVPGVSDVNLLIVLAESRPEAHRAIAEALDGTLEVDPMIIGLPGIERSFRAFAPKFLSIARDYKVLRGADPMAGLAIDPAVERFLCEQALRNARLRLVRAYIVMARDRLRYTRLLIEWIPTLFIDLSEAVRLDGAEIPHDFRDRIAVIGRGLGADASVLGDLLDLKEHPPSPSFDLRLVRGRRLPADEVARLHAGVFALLTHAIDWMSARWPEDVPDGGHGAEDGR